MSMSDKGRLADIRHQNGMDMAYDMPPSPMARVARDVAFLLKHFDAKATEVERLRAENAALRQERATDDKGLVWAVVYGNYFPEEVDSLWATEVLAQERADELGGDWQVTTKRVWQSRKEYVGEEPTDAD